VKLKPGNNLKELKQKRPEERLFVRFSGLFENYYLKCFSLFY